MRHTDPGDPYTPEPKALCEVGKFTLEPEAEMCGNCDITECEDRVEE